MAANTKRANELLATLGPRRIEVQGLSLRKRPRTPSELYWRKKALRRERRR